MRIIYVIWRIIIGIPGIVMDVHRDFGWWNICKGTWKGIRILGFRNVAVANYRACVASFRTAKALASNGWDPEEAKVMSRLAGMAAACGEKPIMVFGGPGGIMQRTVIGDKENVQPPRPH